MSLQFAFAVDNDNQFQKRHFGDADKYLIYKEEGDEIKFVHGIKNQYKMLDEEVEHGSERKGNAIIQFLKKLGVNVLVSQQFGKNIRLVNTHFIPVIISMESPDEVIQILSRHLYWIKDEWGKDASHFKLFTIKSGILKTSINDK
jgi:predicted Fe-Mo cluster-binding NifX family protein